jgi:hypothetical protein
MPALATTARALQLGAEMTECFGGVEHPITRISEQHGNGIAKKMRGDNRPLAVTSPQFEQTLSLCQSTNDRSSPPFLHYPPDNAWNTKTSSASLTDH